MPLSNKLGLYEVGKADLIVISDTDDKRNRYPWHANVGLHGSFVLGQLLQCGKGIQHVTYTFLKKAVLPTISWLNGNVECKGRTKPFFRQILPMVSPHASQYSANIQSKQVKQ